jgi:hypothetical protein
MLAIAGVYQRVRMTVKTMTGKGGLMLHLYKESGPLLRTAFFMIQ